MLGAKVCFFFISLGFLIIGTTIIVKQYKDLRQLMQPLWKGGRESQQKLQTENQPPPTRQDVCSDYVQMCSCQEVYSSLGKLIKAGSRHMVCVC